MAATYCVQAIVHETQKNRYAECHDPRDERNIHTSRYYLVSITVEVDSDEYYGSRQISGRVSNVVQSTVQDTSGSAADQDVCLENKHQIRITNNATEGFPRY